MELHCHPSLGASPHGPRQTRTVQASVLRSCRAYYALSHVEVIVQMGFGAEAHLRAQTTSRFLSIDFWHSRGARRATL